MGLGNKVYPSFDYKPMDVANWFLCNIDREAGDSVTHLKLQKLIYYAQSWSLAVLGKSLFNEDFQAWAHGPVLPKIYEEFRDYGFDAIPQCECENQIDSTEVIELLEEVLSIYGEKSAKYLEDLTHREDPWKLARGPLPDEARCNNVISKESIEKYYSSKLENA